MANTKIICFVIMPIGKTTNEHDKKYWSEHYNDFLKPLIEEQEMKAERSQAMRGNILSEIVSSLVFANIVVADITDANPNVYWELGVRQSFKHGTITIAEKGTKLPFDIGVKGTLFYNPKNYIENEKCRFPRASPWHLGKINIQTSFDLNPDDPAIPRISVSSPRQRPPSRQNSLATTLHSLSNKPS